MASGQARVYITADASGVVRASQEAEGAIASLGEKGSASLRGLSIIGSTVFGGLLAAGGIRGALPPRWHAASRSHCVATTEPIRAARSAVPADRGVPEMSKGVSSAYCFTKRSPSAHGIDLLLGGTRAELVAGIARVQQQDHVAPVGLVFVLVLA
jgi:hypothetical protein